MGWLLIVLLALAAFALAAWAFHLERRLWTTLLAALALGLVGYATQARPDLPSAPHRAAAAGGEMQWGSVEARKEMISARYRSSSNRMIIADALTRQGQFGNAATLLRGTVAENPRDGEAWVALGNALVEHAEGSLTPAALYAFRQAAVAAPQSAAPGYFLGLALVRQGRIPEAREVWQATLARAGGDDEPGALLAERAARLDTLLAQAGALPAAPSANPAPEPPAPALPATGPAPVP
jgi:cytochrome c-type biogenesis protein CcmH